MSIKTKVFGVGSYMLNMNPEQFVLKPVFATIHCDSNWRWKRREIPLPNYDLFYIWNGEGTVILNEKKYHVEKGSCFLFKPGDRPAAEHNPQFPLVLSYIHFDLLNDPEMLPNTFRKVEHTVCFESLLTRYVRLLLVKSFGAEIEAKLILKQLLIQLLREEREQLVYHETTSHSILETIREIANYVRQHPGDEHSVISLATRANLSPRYFSQKFKEIIGQTVRSYIIFARIERAEHLLHSTGMTVTEVAEALGYNDLHFFSRQFKKYTGRNPSQLR